MSASEGPGGDTRLAIGAGVGCYLIWAFVPLVFQAIGRLGVSPWEILVHRVIWSAPCGVIAVLLARQWGQFRAVLRQPRVLAWLTLSSVLIATNWILYIWAVNSGRLLETSLGYYINPLVNMAAGALLFRERINTFGKVAMGLALVGVAIQTAALGHIPFVGLTLAFSFAAYGVVRKQVAADAQTGFLVEVLVVMLPAIAVLVWLEATGHGHFTDGPVDAAWLIACGPITTIPLVLFSWAARRIPLSAMGFIQFMSPTIVFFIGVLQGEAFTPLRALSFGFIWGGVAVFIAGALRAAHTLRRAAGG